MLRVGLLFPERVEAGELFTGCNGAHCPAGLYVGRAAKGFGSEMLVQIADTNEARTARQIDLAVRILEPILLAMMAGMVFCIAVALLLPILTMGSGLT